MSTAGDNIVSLIIIFLFACVWWFVVAQTGQVGAGKVLRDGERGEGEAHADVPWLVGT